MDSDYEFCKWVSPRDRYCDFEWKRASGNITTQDCQIADKVKLFWNWDNYQLSYHGFKIIRIIVNGNNVVQYVDYISTSVTSQAILMLCSRFEHKHHFRYILSPAHQKSSPSVTFQAVFNLMQSLCWPFSARNTIITMITTNTQLWLPPILMITILNTPG